MSPEGKQNPILPESLPAQCPCPALLSCTVTTDCPAEVVLPPSPSQANGQPPSTGGELCKTSEDAEPSGTVPARLQEASQMDGTLAASGGAVAPSQAHSGSKRGAKAGIGKEGGHPGMEQLRSPVSPAVCPVGIDCP